MANKTYADNAADKHNANDLKDVKSVRNVENISGKQMRKEPGLPIGI